MKFCTVEGCEKAFLARGWCRKHYARFTRHGDPTVVHNAVRKTPEEAFASRTKRVDGCLEWLGARSNQYGQMWDGQRKVRAHRWAYEQGHGPIPAGLVIDHKCHNKLCVEIGHLRLATKSQNGENLSQLRADNTSGFRNVSWNKVAGKWLVKVNSKGVAHRGGLFEDIDKANEAAIALRNKLFTHNDKDK